jgi:hypothetical protein
MAVLKLETLEQSVLAREVVVAGSERCGTRLADRATPTFLPFAWLPSDGYDQALNPLVNHGKPVMPHGLRAGRSARWSGSSRSRRVRALRRWRTSLTPRVTAMTRVTGRCPAIASGGLKPTAVQ